MGKLIDTHCHPYYWPSQLGEARPASDHFGHYDQDRAEMLERAFEVCEAIISVGSDIDESKKSIELAADNDQIFAAVGVHPHSSSDPKLLDELVKNPKVVGIGECGLDYKPYQNETLDKPRQQESLSYQIRLANQHNLPIIIHARECWEDLIPILTELRPKSGLIHSWTGGLKEADQIINLGVHLSFSGMLTYPANEHIRAVAKMAPADKILVETDSPFLPPQPMRGQRNEPANVKIVAEALAELRGVSLDEISALTTANARRLFSLKT